MSTQANNPIVLDAVHCKTLDDCLRACSITQDAIEKCKRAGLDMAAAEEQNQMHASVAKGLRQEFFHGK